MLSLDEITVQWIHKDVRGEIVCFYKDGTEYTILTTRAGFARGGCVHDFNREHFVVLKGKVLYYIFSPQTRLIRRKLYQMGESGFVYPAHPHYLIAVNDAITLEWGATTEEKKKKHVEIRDVVDKINIQQALLRIEQIDDRSDE